MKHRWNLILTFFLVMILSTGVHAQQQFTLDSGTRVPLRFISPFDMTTAQQGQTVHFRVASDVRVGGRTVFRQGAVATGTILSIMHPVTSAPMAPGATQTTPQPAPGTAASPAPSTPASPAPGTAASPAPSGPASPAPGAQATPAPDRPAGQQANPPGFVPPSTTPPGTTAPSTVTPSTTTAPSMMAQDVVRVQIGRVRAEAIDGTEVSLAPIDVSLANMRPLRQMDMGSNDMRTAETGVIWYTQMGTGMPTQAMPHGFAIVPANAVVYTTTLTEMQIDYRDRYWNFDTRF